MTIFVDERGTGHAPAVVLLHGLGTTGWMWHRLAAVLGHDLHLLLPDLPGHGRSRGRPWVSVADSADAVAELIRSRVPGGRAHVVGLSLGGYVTVQLAADRPDVVESALVSGVNVLPSSRPRLIRLGNLVMSPFMTTGPMLRASARAFRVPAEDFDEYAASARAVARGTFRRVGGEALAFRVPATAATSPRRLLAVAGEHEQELILRSLPKLAYAFPDARARIAPGVGHGWVVEAPDLFAEMVRAHVAGADPPAALRPAPTR
ncbi:alpha/beta hydrolase [Micromonospora sp. NBC_01699]|uniref:alpha/beta fold hydrolase n=1 Tax=Micromonospora sp. NBC_01699 TaxID=2975984 RepID=UPI002E36E850|nr:alpha/beta hydrolase [Micromonospora sp. NBC_01699]